MGFLGFINEQLNVYGGPAAILIVLIAFLKDVSFKRIIRQETHEINKNLKKIEHDYDVEINSLKELHEKDMELIKQVHIKDLELFRNNLKYEFIKGEAYSSISKEKYQKLFEQRVSIYHSLLKIKYELDERMLKSIGYYEFCGDYYEDMKSAIEKINSSVQKNPMVISNELARVSNELYSKYFEIKKEAERRKQIAEYHSDGSHEDEESIHEEERVVFSNLTIECDELYKNWFKQLDEDVGKIRSILDVSSNFLDQQAN